MTQKTINQAIRKAVELDAARELHAKLAAVNIDAVPVRRDIDRCAPRKELAAAARAMFKALGIKGVRFTTPNYSMAQAVDVSLEKRGDYGQYDAMHGLRDDPAHQANRAADATVRAILDRAFPNHRDKSDTQTDYYNYRWSIN